MLLRALCRRNPDSRFKQQTDAAVCATGVACGCAVTWRTECVHHSGKTVPFDLSSKFFDPTAINVVLTDGFRSDMQSILDAMILGVAPQADPSFAAWHHSVRHCSFCEEKGKLTQALQKLQLIGGGPSHFFAQTEARLKKRGSVKPSPSVLVFGAHYSLCAVVYATRGCFHFVSQVYLPEHKCWVIYDDIKSSKASVLNQFDANYHKGDENMFLYIRNDTLRGLGCLVRDEIKKEDSSSSGSQSMGTSEREGSGSLAKARRAGLESQDEDHNSGGKRKHVEPTDDVANEGKPTKFKVRETGYIPSSKRITSSKSLSIFGLLLPLQAPNV